MPDEKEKPATPLNSAEVGVPSNMDTHTYPPKKIESGEEKFMRAMFGFYALRPVLREKALAMQREFRKQLGLEEPMGDQASSSEVKPMEPASSKTGDNTATPKLPNNSDNAHTKTAPARKRGLILEHPRLATVLTVLGLAIAFSQRASAVAVWACTLVVGTIIAGWIVETGQEKTWSKFKTYGFVLGSGVLLIVFGLFLEGWNFVAVPPQTDKQIIPSVSAIPPVTIFAECEMAYLPVPVPPRSYLDIVSLNRKSTLSQNWGFYGVGNGTDGQQQWPSKKALEAYKKIWPPGVYGYRCDVSNHSQVNVLNVALTLSVSFAGDKNSINFTPILTPLDAGGHFVFYIFNDCQPAATVILPNIVTLSVVGEVARRTVPLDLPHRNPVEGIMSFFPTKVQLTGQMTCE